MGNNSTSHTTPTGGQHNDSKKPILIVSVGNAFPSIVAREGDFDDWIANGLGCHSPIVRIDARDTAAVFPPLDSFAGIVVTGSHAMVTDHEPWSERLAVWLRESIEAEVPLLGICYGHQLIAYAAGGEVGYHPHGIEIGTHAITLNDDAVDDTLLGQMPKVFDAQLVHSQSVLRLPSGAILLAGNPHEPHQAFRLGRCTWGVQFHPEFSASAMKAYIAEMSKRPAYSAVPLSELGQHVRATPQASSLLGTFARIAAARHAYQHV